MPESFSSPPEFNSNRKEETLAKLNSAETRVYILKITHTIKSGISNADADDIAQDVMFKANEAIEKGQFRYETDLKPWLYKIIRNLIISSARSESRKRKRGLVDEIPTGFEAQDQKPDSREMLELKLKDKKIQELLNQLGPTHKLVIQLYLQGYTQKEIGLQLGVAQGTAGRLTHDAKKRIFELLEENEEK